ITYRRNGEEKTTSAVLSANTGTYEKIASGFNDKLGADLETLDKKLAEKYEIEGGVVVKKIKQGGAFSNTRMQDGFIITSINGVEISSIEQLNRAVSSFRGETMQLEGIYPGYDGIYRYPLNLAD
ncbi:MAG: serine protease, partial [Candidatus Hydrogenedentes bacterium]|nr:serine protease [Candidatus Hydrogenedentota bacterium]